LQRIIDTFCATAVMEQLWSTVIILPRRCGEAAVATHAAWETCMVPMDRRASLATTSNPPDLRQT
jgi:hypothetical protein